MMRENRIKYYVPADYSDGAQLDKLVKAIIDRTAKNEVLEEIHFQCKKETIDADKQNSEEEQEKASLLIALENSRSFARTHEIIEKLSRFSVWSPDEQEVLFRSAATNSQIRYIINDADVQLFYSRILKNAKQLTKNAKDVKEWIESGE